MDGILLVDKPAGWTSHDVVAKVRKIASAAAGKKVKIGHTGTLDPAATGLLILVLGSYTKRAAEFSKLDKTYEAEITLGATSTTGDKEGEIRVVESGEGIVGSKKPTEKRIREVLSSFEGKQSQTPHIYSAIKVGGQRAYKMARQGQTPELMPRQVTVHRLQVTEYKYPVLKIVTEVSSGTYIRSLAEDIGTKLGTGAYLSNLRRTSVGKYKIDDALDLEDIDSNTLASKFEQGL